MLRYMHCQMATAYHGWNHVTILEYMRVPQAISYARSGLLASEEVLVHLVNIEIMCASIAVWLKCKQAL